MSGKTAKRARAAALAAGATSLRAVAADARLSTNTVRRWKSEADLDHGNRKQP